MSVEFNPDSPLSSASISQDAALLLLRWYRANKRALPWRDTGNAEDVWISEIMLQQTRVEAVKNYFCRFREALPTVRDIASCEDDRLMKLWEGLGYYHRARNIKKCAQQLLELYGGALPSDPELLKKLPGIGPYTAGAIASIAYGVRVPAVDGNVLRVWARLTGNHSDIALSKTGKDFAGEIGELIASCTSPEFSASDFNQALMELGAVVCVPNGAALCGSCPVRGVCRAHKGSETELLPVRSSKKARRVERRTLLIIRDGERFLFRRRPDRGLLPGLYEFPGLPGALGPEEVKREAERLGFSPLQIRPLPEGRHIFTHIEWQMSAWEIRVAEFPDKAEKLRAPGAGSRKIRELRIAEEGGGPGAAGESGWPWAPAEFPRSAHCVLIKKEELQNFAVPSAFRTWIQWYSFNQ